MDAKTICLQQLSHLSTAVIMGRKAPHKAVLLLAIMNLVESGEIETPRVVLTKQLEGEFKREWKRFIGEPLVFKCKVATPFWHMKNEPFYSLFFNTGDEIKVFEKPYSVKRLRQDTYSVLDRDFFRLLQNKQTRTEIRELLIDTYLQGLHSDLAPLTSRHSGGNSAQDSSPLRKRC